jgi:hypothetical protein
MTDLHLQRILITNDSGGCSVVVPAPNTGLTLEQLVAKVVPPGAAYSIVGVGDVPADRTYRNAWRHDTANLSVGVDMPAAREIHKNYMRAARTPRLADLDVQYSRADEANNPALKAQIAAKKQQLRDVTADPGLAAAQTPTDLKAVWPTILGPNPLQ